MTASVALCTYNGENFLREQLESILNQSVAVDEIVICDDVSSDNTVAIIEEYQKKYPGIFKFHANRENIGYVKNFEKAISLCTRDLIFLCDQDDVWLPNKVENCKDVFRKNQNANMLVHNLYLLEDHQKLEKNYWEYKEFLPNLSQEKILERILFEGQVFPGMSLVITHEAKKTYLPLKKIDAKIIHDFELLLQSLKDEKLIILNEVLAFYRLHKNQNIGYDYTIKKNNLAREDLYLYFKKFQMIKKIVHKFGLNTQVLENYKLLCKVKYQEYINTFSGISKIIEILKLKYYFKIFKALK